MAEGLSFLALRFLVYNTPSHEERFSRRLAKWIGGVAEPPRFLAGDC